MAVKKLKHSGLVDKTFYKRVRELMKVAVPSYTCKEAKYCWMLAVLIALRTQMSIWLADANGRVVRSIIQGDFKQFLQRIAFILLFSIPSSAVNSGLDYF